MDIIFLDIDGVLTDQWSDVNQLSPRCLSILADILRKTGAKIVISSTWRIGGIGPGSDWQKAIQLWVADSQDADVILGAVVGATPDIDAPEVTRGKEINWWISDNPGVNRFVILDDEDDMDPHLDHLVQIDANKGLTDTDAMIILKQLRD
jgi:hypothetical protein